MRTNWVISTGKVEIVFDKLLEDRDKAIHIRIEDKKYWLPKSQTNFQEWSNIVEIPVWLAEQKGLVI